MSLVEESHVGVDICPTPSATCNDLVLNDRHVIVDIMERSIRLDDESKRELGLLQQGVGGGNRVYGGSNVFGGAVGVR